MSSLVYPLEIQSGDIVITDDLDNINRDAIESSIRTRIDERVMRPDYGRDIEPFQTVTDLGSIARSVRRAIDSGTDDYDLGAIAVLSYLRGEATVAEVRYQSVSTTYLEERQVVEIPL